MGMRHSTRRLAISVVAGACIAVVACRAEADTELQRRLQSLSLRYADRAATLLDKSSGAFRDPFETIYGEGYGPACAAVVAAEAYRWTADARYCELAVSLIERAFLLVRNPQPYNSTFTHLFLMYYSLLAYEALADELPASTRLHLEEEFRDIAHGREPTNTNGLTMLLCYDVNRALLGLGTWDALDAQRRLDMLRSAVGTSGFINDAPGRNSQPVAYHLYVTCLLTDTIALAAKRPPTDQSLCGIIDAMTGIRNAAAAWCDRFIAADGSFTMTERSRDQFWTCGSLAFVEAALGRSADRHVDWWARFVKSDGTISVTPNFFSNALRVGFESYSNVSMYNGLGFAYLARAAALLERTDTTRSWDVEEDMVFVDRDAGYAHVRRSGSSLGIALRRHAESYYGGYAAPLSPINVSLGGSRRRPLANPSYRSAGARVESWRTRSVAPEHGVYEGFLVRRGDQWLGADWTTNASVEEGPKELVFTAESGPVGITKHLALDASALSLRYRFKVAKPIDEIRVQFPMLVSDGRDDTVYSVERNCVTMSLGEERYRLTVLPEHAHWDVSQVVYLTSTSGAVRQLSARISGPLSAGQSAECEVQLERLE